METNQGYWSKQQFSRRRALSAIGLGAAGLAGAALIGCGDDDDDEGAPTGGAAVQARAAGEIIDIGTAPAYSAKFPEKSQVLSNWHWSKHPDRLNPQVPQAGGVYTSWFGGSSEHSFPTSGSQGAAAMAGLASNMILNIAGGPFADNDLLEVSTDNALSETFEQPDDLTYVFHLRRNAKWQNVPPVNGRAFVSEDAQFAYDVLKNDPKSVQSSSFELVESIEVPDENTLRVKMSAPYAAFLRQIAVPFTSMFSREQWEGPDGLSKITVGTGPFIQKELDPAAADIYVKNPDYWITDQWGTQLPYLDGIIDLVIADNQSAQAAFVSKQIDYIGHFQIPQVEDFADMRNRVPEHGAQVWPVNGTFMYMLHLNQANPILNDVRGRQALSMSIDRVNTFIDTQFRGSASTEGFLVHTFFGKRFPPTVKELGKYFEYNPTEARKLLEAAGVSLPLELEVMNSSGSREAFVEAVTPDAREAGIELKLNSVESLAAVNAYFSREWKDLHTWSQLTIHGTDMDGWAYERFHSTSPQNSGGYSNPKVDDLAERQRSELDADKRLELHKEEHKILLDDIPLIVAGGPFESVMWHAYVHEFSDNFVNWQTSWNSTQFQRVWMDSRAPKRSVRQLLEDPKGYVKKHFAGVRRGA